MQARRFLFVWASQLSQLMWSCIGASINCILFWLQNALICCPVWHRAWFNLIERGIPCSKILQNFKISALALSNTSAVGNFENRSIHARIGPPKSIWISSFGTLHNFNGAHLLARIIDFNFLPIFTQGLHFAVFVIVPVHVRPPFMVCHICHPPCSRVSGIYGLDVCIFDCMMESYPVVDAYTSILDMTIFPEWVCTAIFICSDLHFQLRCSPVPPLKSHLWWWGWPLAC